MSIYGFEKLGERNDWCFYHHNFHRDFPEKLVFISRDGNNDDEPSIPKSSDMLNIPAGVTNGNMPLSSLLHSLPMSSQCQVPMQSPHINPLVHPMLPPGFDPNYMNPNFISNSQDGNTTEASLLQSHAQAQAQAQAQWMMAAFGQPTPMSYTNMNQINQPLYSNMNPAFMGQGTPQFLGIPTSPYNNQEFSTWPMPNLFNPNYSNYTLYNNNNNNNKQKRRP